MLTNNATYFIALWILLRPFDCILSSAIIGSFTKMEARPILLAKREGPILCQKGRGAPSLYRNGRETGPFVLVAAVKWAAGVVGNWPWQQRGVHSRWGVRGRLSNGTSAEHRRDIDGTIAEQTRNTNGQMGYVKNS